MKKRFGEEINWSYETAVGIFTLIVHTIFAKNCQEKTLCGKGWT